MRVLFVGGFGLGESLRDLVEGFELRGIDYAYLPYMGKVENPAALRQALDTGEFTAVIGFCPFYNNPETLTLLTNSKPLKLMWEFDCPHREISKPDELLQQLRPWDGALVSSIGPYVEDFYQHRAHKPYWGPLPPPALNIPLNNPGLNNDASRYLLTFIGQKYDPNILPRTVVPRHEFVPALQAHYGQDFGLWGGGWETGNGHLPWSHCLYYWGLPTFTIGHHGEIDDRWYFNARDTLAMGAGACYIQDRANQMDTFFSEGEECFFYESTQEIIDIVDTYRDQPEVVEAVRAAGQARVQAEFGQGPTTDRICTIISQQTSVEVGSTESPIRYEVEPLDDEANVRSEVNGLWATGEVRDHYEFRPLGLPAIPTPVERGAAGLRLYAYDGSRLIGHVALLNKHIGPFDVGGVCGLIMDQRWQEAGATVQLVRVLKAVGRAAGYQAIVGWTSGAPRFWAHAGLHTQPGGAAGCWVYDRSITPEALMLMSTPYQGSW